MLCGQMGWGEGPQWYFSAMDPECYNTDLPGNMCLLVQYSVKVMGEPTTFSQHLRPAPPEGIHTINLVSTWLRGSGTEG